MFSNLTEYDNCFSFILIPRAWSGPGHRGVLPDLGTLYSWHLHPQSSTGLCRQNGQPAQVRCPAWVISSGPQTLKSRHWTDFKKALTHRSQQETPPAPFFMFSFLFCTFFLLLPFAFSSWLFSWLPLVCRHSTLLVLARWWYMRFLETDLTQNENVMTWIGFAFDVISDPSSVTSHCLCVNALPFL